MAVFTTITEEGLARYIYMFDRGELHTFEPITSGIENSNYFVTLDQDGHLTEYVLTITEGIDFSDAPFFNNLMSHLSHYGLPVPDAIKTLDGVASTILKGKPAWLFPKLPGVHLTEVSPDHCRQIGEALAGIHEATQQFSYSRQNPYGDSWTEETLNIVSARLNAEDLTLLTGIAAEYREANERLCALPTGKIHGDLFRDNALFSDEKLTGIIDFYHACDDILLTDLAVSLNDWASQPDGTMDHSREQAMLAGYEAVRPLTADESSCLPLLRRYAAMRFVLTRLLSGENGKYLKDPEEFLRIIRNLPAG